MMSEEITRTRSLWRYISTKKESERVEDNKGQSQSGQGKGGEEDIWNCRSNRDRISETQGPILGGSLLGGRYSPSAEGQTISTGSNWLKEKKKGQIRRATHSGERARRSNTGKKWRWGRGRAP